MKQAKTLLSIILIFAMAFMLCGCANEEKSDLWADALHTKDTELGEGAKTLVVQVKAEDKAVKFTLHTDAETVGDALIENKLLEGEPSSMGIYITSINGIVADYDENMSYWAFYIDGEYANTGVDSTPIDENAEYIMEYTIME